MKHKIFALNIKDDKREMKVKGDKTEKLTYLFLFFLNV